MACHINIEHRNRTWPSNVLVYDETLQITNRQSFVPTSEWQEVWTNGLDEKIVCHVNTDDTPAQFTIANGDDPPDDDKSYVLSAYQTHRFLLAGGYVLYVKSGGSSPKATVNVDNLALDANVDDLEALVGATNAGLGTNNETATATTAAGTLNAMMRQLKNMLYSGTAKVDGSAVTQPVRIEKATIGSPTQVDASVTAVDVLAENASRKGASFYYDGAAVLYLLFANTTPTSSVFSVKMGADHYTFVELPAGYTGVVKGIWSSAVGAVAVTELT
jgi:hypothetical protein